MSHILRIGFLLTLFVSGSANTAWTQDREDSRDTPLVKMLRNVRPSVAAIFSQSPDGQLTSGSGSVIHPKGYVLTNDHVVQDRPGVVLLENQPPIQYRHVGRMPELDLAIVRIPTQPDLPTIELGRSHDLAMGENITNLGNPGGRGIVATSGIISSPSLKMGNALALSRLPQDARNRMIQFDAASNGGNSGGPLVNVFGQQIGVVQGMFGPEENSNLAIPIDRLRANLGQIISSDIFRRIDVGLEVDPLADVARITSITENSPASAADLRVGDVITQADRQPVNTPIDWIIGLNELPIAAPIDLTVRRREKEVELRLTARKRDPLAAIDSQVAINLQPGLRCRVYHYGESLRRPLQAISDRQPDVETKTDIPVARPDAVNRDDYFALVYDGFLKVDKSGPYRLTIGSDDGSRLFLHDALLIDNDGTHPEEYRGSWCLLEQGWHPFRLEFFEYYGGEELTMTVQKPGDESKPVTADMLAHLASEKPASEGPQ